MASFTIRSTVPVQDCNGPSESATRSDWAQHQKTNGSGEFDFGAVPLGEYTVTSHPGEFPASTAECVVESGTNPVLHFQWRFASVNRKKQL